MSLGLDMPRVFFALLCASQACHGFVSDVEQVCTCLFPAAPLVFFYLFPQHAIPFFLKQQSLGPQLSSEKASLPKAALTWWPKELVVSSGKEVIQHEGVMYYTLVMNFTRKQRTGPVWAAAILQK